jgi:glycosyltransferase involved in cell wall biosynthesis
MRILINIPCLSLPGGVANHYKGLLPFWSHDVKYNVVGSRGDFFGSLYLIYDYIKFLIIIVFGRYDVVLLNPSLGRTAILRDSIFLIIAKIFQMRVAVFFHGWDSRQQNLIDKNPKYFIKIFQKANVIIVLANEFANRLRTWGIINPIFIASTKVDDRLVSKFNITGKKYGKTILFLARVEENKGIFVVLQAFSKVLSRNPEARLVVAGSGNALDSARYTVRSQQLPNVEFLGNVTGHSLIKAFNDSDVYVLPTFHGEGLPTSVLEAMAFGLPVITRPVGGLKDFFENRKMGYISNSCDPQWYADVINMLFLDRNQIKRIGFYNHYYAIENFIASKVVRKLEAILETV